jgi:hypothetical protein
LKDTAWFPLWVALACIALYAATLPLGTVVRALRRQEGPGHLRGRRSHRVSDHDRVDEGPEPRRARRCFFVFRFFDIAEPWPCRRMEKIGGGHGILLDDVFRGRVGLVVIMLRLVTCSIP